MVVNFSYSYNNYKQVTSHYDSITIVLDHYSPPTHTHPHRCLYKASRAQWQLPHLPTTSRNGTSSCKPSKQCSECGWKCNCFGLSWRGYVYRGFVSCMCMCIQGVRIWGLHLWNQGVQYGDWIGDTALCVITFVRLTAPLGVWFHWGVDPPPRLRLHFLHRRLWLEGANDGRGTEHCRHLCMPQGRWEELHCTV